jgi:hypothetical protein
MKYRVKITKAPKYNVRVKMPEAKTGMQVEGSLYNEIASFGGADQRELVPKTEVRKTITKVPREEANLEAEGGETVLTFDAAGYPLFYEIKGPRHSNNGVPLNLPDDSFIFSDTRSMRITDQEILDMFGLSKKKGGYTPADISKKYLELNKYREILQSPDSDKIAQATAERMIKNMIIKLGALAIAQESKKGFPQGVPAVARPYMEAYGISEEELVPEQQGQEEMYEDSPMESGVEQVPPTQAEQEDMMQMPPEMMEQAPMAMYGAVMGGYNMPFEYEYGGYLPKALTGAEMAELNRRKTREELEAEYRSKNPEVTPVKTVPKGAELVYEGDGEKIYGEGTIYEKEDLSNVQPKPVKKLATDKAKYERDICARIKREGVSLERAIAEKWIAPERAADFANCVDKSKVKTDDAKFYRVEEPPIPPRTQKQCECVDPETGDVTYSEPDENGQCPCYSYEELSGGQELMTNPFIQQRGTVYPEDAAAFAATLGYRLPRKDPMAVGPRGTQLEMYGIDWRGAANTNMAGANAAQRAYGQIASANPASYLAGSYETQKAADAANKAAIDQANKFNTDTRNQEIMTNTQLRQGFLDKDAAYKLDYDAKLAQQAQNQARNYNAKVAESMNKLQQMGQNAQNLALVNESMEWQAYDPVTKKFYQKKPWELGYDPNATKGGADQIAARVTEIMQQNPDITDTTAYKIATQQTKFGGATMFKDGGYIYTVFPVINL